MVVHRGTAVHEGPAMQRVQRTTWLCLTLENACVNACVHGVTDNVFLDV